jgi:hypothetical protein
VSARRTRVRVGEVVRVVMETGEIVVICVAVLTSVAFPVWFFRSLRASAERNAAMREDFVTTFRPTRTLAEGAVALSAPVELRAQAVHGALRVWLDCAVSRPAQSWSVSGTLSFRAVPQGAGYRADHASIDVPFTVGEDSEGYVSAIPCPANTAGIRGPSGALSMESASGGVLLQLAELTSSAPGTELFVRVALGERTGAAGATFRAFISVSDV